MSHIKIDENRMRAHFLQCLELGRFEPFPEKQTNTVTLFSPEKITTVELFCICKMPWVWYHSKNPDLSQVTPGITENEKNIPRDVFNKFKRSVEWHCSNCKKVHIDWWLWFQNYIGRTLNKCYIMFFTILTIFKITLLKFVFVLFFLVSNACKMLGFGSISTVKHLNGFFFAKKVNGWNSLTI